MAKKNGTNVHHLYPKWQGGTNSPDNLKIMDIYKHRALHFLTDVNGKATAPKEQIEIILNILTTCLTDEVKNDFGKIFEIDDPKYFYKNGIYRPK